MDVINVYTESIRKYVEERMVLNDHRNKGHGKKHFKGLCFGLTWLRN